MDARYRVWFDNARQLLTELEALPLQMFEKDDPRRS